MTRTRGLLSTAKAVATLAASDKTVNTAAAGAPDPPPTPVPPTLPPAMFGSGWPSWGSIPAAVSPTLWIAMWTALWVVAGLAVLAVVIGLVGQRLAWLRHRRCWRDAHLLTVLAPPTVEPDGAQALWSNLAGLIRPRWRRRLSGQPHLSFEYRMTAHGASVHIWVPGTVPPGLVERAVTAAWPGAATTTRTISRPNTPDSWPAHLGALTRLSRTASSRGGAGRPNEVVCAGGVLRLARATDLPIDDNTAGDPIGTLIAACDLPTPPPPPRSDTQRGTSESGDEVVVQILARSVPAGRRPAGWRGARDGSRVGGAGRALVLGLAGAALWVVRELLSLAVPGPVGHRSVHRGGATAAGRSPGHRPGARPVDPRARLDQSGRDRAAVAKARGPAFETLIRYAALVHPTTTSTETTSTETRTGIGNGAATAARTGNEARRVAVRVARGRAHAVAAVFAAFGGHNFYRRRRLWWPADAIGHRYLGRGDVLSISELAAIAGLPTGIAPTLLRARARAVPPPPAIAAPGALVKPLGDTVVTSSTGGSGRPIGVGVADARHHLHVIGTTGTGKSTLLVQLALADIRARRGVVVVDPKGDLVTDILDRLPDRVRDRVILIDPDQIHTDPTAIPNLNPLAAISHPTEPASSATPTMTTRRTGQAQTSQTATATDPTALTWTAPKRTALEKTAAERAADALRVENLVAICRNVYAGWWGPRSDDLLRAACLTLLADPSTPRSLGDVPTLLTNPVERKALTAPLTDAVLLGFWSQYELLSPSAQAMLTAPLLNKLRALLLRPFTRSVLGADHPGRRSQFKDAAPGPGPGVDFGAVLDGGIVLARLPKGSLGEEGTRLVGSIIVAHTWAAATARTRLPQHLRRDATLTVDECQNFLALPDDIADILAEARGLRLGLILAHQNLGQLPPRLREGISANARNKVFFTVSPDDAPALARHTRPLLDEHDLAHLDAYHVAARLVRDGADTPAFTLRTRALPPRRTEHPPRTHNPGEGHTQDRRPPAGPRARNPRTTTSVTGEDGLRAGATQRSPLR